MKKPLTFVISRNGLLVLALADVSTADAERWAEEGCQVFRVAVDGVRWAVNHVNSGRVMSFADEPDTPNRAVFDVERALLPPPKEGE